MKSKGYFPLLFVSLLLWLSSQNTYAASYGYLLKKTPTFSVWWTEAPYKVMKDTKIPQNSRTPVYLEAAGNEYESFQIIVYPEETIKNFFIKAGSLVSAEGKTINPVQITIRKVDYVHVIRPTDAASQPGWYPDPLPLLGSPTELLPDKNHPFFITVHVPAEAKPGIYSGNIVLTAENLEFSVPLKLQVWNFKLPDKPAIRSSFGFNPKRFVREYHNAKTLEELREATDKYFQVFRDYKIAPADPFLLYPVQVNIKGLYWKGGIFDSDTVYEGKMSLRVTDDTRQQEHAAFTKDFIPVSGGRGNYVMQWAVKTATPAQPYTILIQCYDKNKTYLPWENREKVFQGSISWKEETFYPGRINGEIAFVKIFLFPAFRTLHGCDTGTAWFDNLFFSVSGNTGNLIPQGDFEVSVKDLGLQIDFSDFDRAGKRYLDDFGFNAFNLSVEGLPSGDYYHRRKGVFHGLIQGTPAYDFLFNYYLRLFQDHLEEKGWLDKAYVYWFDEPAEKDYPFVKEGMELIHRAAPKLKRFITEDSQPPDNFMEQVEISCPKISRVRPEEVLEMSRKGKEYWSYVCCCPTSPWLSEFIDHPAINMRMWLWISFKYQLKGILVWETIYWNSRIASPKGVLQNPWENPMSYTDGYGRPYGIQLSWGNGDGRFFYPPKRDPNDHSEKIMDFVPVPSLRLETLRDGIEDYEYLVMLKKALEKKQIRNNKWQKQARDLLDLPEEIFVSFSEYNKDPQCLIRYREKIAVLLNKINR